MSRTRKLIALALVGALAAAGVSALRAATRAVKGYAIAEITVTDPEIYKEYIAAVSPVVAQFGGKYIVRGGQAVAVEGDPPSGRVVVIEFDSPAAARSFEYSNEYQAVAPLRKKSSLSRIYLVEGAPIP